MKRAACRRPRKGSGRRLPVEKSSLHFSTCRSRRSTSTVDGQHLKNKKVVFLNSEKINFFLFSKIWTS